MLRVAGCAEVFGTIVAIFSLVGTENDLVAW